MQKKRSLRSLRLSRLAVCLGIAGMIFNIETNAQTPGCTGDCYSCQIIGSSIHNPAGPLTTIYDDGVTNYGTGCAYTPGSYNGGWNCGRQWLLTEYTGTGTNIALQFSYAGPETCTFSDTNLHDVYVYNNTTHTLLTTSPIVRPDYDTGTELPTIDTLPSIYTAERGELIISYYRHGAIYGTDSPDIRGRVLLVPQVQKLWITAPPVCAGFAGNYHFQLHSIPPLDSLIVPSLSWSEVTGSTDCGDALPENIMTLDFATSSNVPVQQGWSFYGYIAGPSVPGNGWEIYSSLYPDTAYGPLDLNDYWIDSSAIDSIITAGSPPVIILNYSDGISESFSDTVNLIIEYPAIPSASYPGNPTGTPVGPPNATGIPWPSYDIYDYTVNGAEVWTPTSNPIQGMNPDVADSIIRIQDNLTIPPGSTLTLRHMTLQFGPGATLIGQPATVSTGIGGILYLDTSTLTAYRGCDGTDRSTWSGVKLIGNPAWPFSVYGDEGPSPQSEMVLKGGNTISYADTGVENGTGPANSGGSVISLNDYYYLENTFYNNQISAFLWPCNPALSGSGQATWLEFNKCNFTADTHAWFTPAYMLCATDIEDPIGLSNDTFSNLTGRPIQDAVYANEAGFYVSYDAFNDFYYGINDWSASGLHSLNLNNNVFNGNNISVMLQGAVAPIITNNTFNVPACISCASFDYSVSDVLIVNEQNIGVYLNGCSGYEFYHNAFKSAAYGYNQYTTGTLEYSNGSDNNVVTGNTFTGLGAAMLSNFINNNTSISTPFGLIYDCNSDTSVAFDITALGANGGSGGIAYIQGTNPVYGRATWSAANIFSTEWNVYNTQQPLFYLYDNAIAPQIPVNYTAGVTPFAVANSGACLTGPIIRPVNLGSLGNIPVYVAAGSNVNYYQTGRHANRDSVYYYAAQMNSPYGTLLIANMLVQDNFYDSAQATYDGIFGTYQIDSSSPEGQDFVQGRNLLDLLIYKQTNSEPLMSLSPSEVTTLQSVKANATMWAHARAEGWLYAYDTTQHFTDTLLYPNPPDTVFADRHSNPASVTPAAKTPPNRVHPNPVQDLLDVFYTAQTAQPVTIQIEDISGRTIITQPLQSGIPATVNVSQLAPGMYLYRISEGTHATMIGKIAKE